MNRRTLFGMILIVVFLEIFAPQAHAAVVPTTE